MKKSLAALALSFSVLAAQAETFDINLNETNNPSGVLSGIYEVPPNASTATGGEVGVGVEYSNDTGNLTVNLAYGLFGFQQLQGNFTAAFLMRGAAGENGTLVFDLTPSHVALGTKSGFISGTFPLNLSQETSLFANELYVNITSSSFAGGEIRAQLIPSTVPEPTTWALLGAGLVWMVALRRWKR